jgi:hypothetical protein
MQSLIHVFENQDKKTTVKYMSTNDKEVQYLNIEFEDIAPLIKHLNFIVSVKSDEFKG